MVQKSCNKIHVGGSTVSFFSYSYGIEVYALVLETVSKCSCETAQCIALVAYNLVNKSLRNFAWSC